jgi:hypothetical protein
MTLVPSMSRRWFGPAVRAVAGVLAIAGLALLAASPARA